MEHACKALAVITIWAAPAWMVVQTGNSHLAWLLIISGLVTFPWLAPYQAATRNNPSGS